MYSMPSTPGGYAGALAQQPPSPFSSDAWVFFRRKVGCPWLILKIFLEGVIIVPTERLEKMIPMMTLIPMMTHISVKYPSSPEYLSHRKTMKHVLGFNMLLCNVMRTSSNKRCNMFLFSFFPAF